MSIHPHNDEKGGRPPPVARRVRRDGQKFSERGVAMLQDAQKFWKHGVVALQDILSKTFGAFAGLHETEKIIFQ